MMSIAHTLGVEFTRASRRAADFVSLMKPRILLMVLFTTCAGFYLGVPGGTDYAALLQVLIGTALAGGGTLALNQFLERDLDTRMVRTQLRPLPSGRLQPTEALLFGVLLVIVGLLYLALSVNVVSSIAAAATMGGYLLLYTPMKRKSAWCLVIGALPGALPPLIGWTAATGGIGSEAWVLFTILYVWQLPHTLAIAMQYRDDFARAGIRLLPAIDPNDTIARVQIVTHCLLLLAVSLLPTVIGFAGLLYGLGAVTLGLGMLGCAVVLIRRRSTTDARRLVLASLVYLPVLLLLMMVDQVPL